LRILYAGWFEKAPPVVARRPRSGGQLASQPKHEQAGHRQVGGRARIEAATLQRAVESEKPPGRS